MAGRNLGTIRIRGKVVVEWDSGTRQEIGEVEADVEIVLPDDRPTSISRTRTQPEVED